MAWDKIEDHLFEKYCVEGEDAEFCRLMEEHDSEIRSQAITEFVESVKDRAHSKERNDWSADYMISIWESVIDEIAEELKGE